MGLLVALRRGEHSRLRSSMNPSGPISLARKTTEDEPERGSARKKDSATNLSEPPLPRKETSCDFSLAVTSNIPAGASLLLEYDILA